MNKKILTFITVFCLVPFLSLAEYPSTSIGVVDLNKILSESDAAMNAAEQIEEIASNIENEIKESDQAIINEQNLLIESQTIMAPEAFETKRIDYENKVQKYNSERQAKLVKIDELIATSRNEVLLTLKPILEEIANEKGITVLLEKGSVILNADKMDITDSVLKMLNKEMPKLKVSRD